MVYKLTQLPNKFNSRQKFYYLLNQRREVIASSLYNVDGAVGQEPVIIAAAQRGIKLGKMISNKILSTRNVSDFIY